MLTKRRLLLALGLVIALLSSVAVFLHFENKPDGVPGNFIIEHYEIKGDKRYFDSLSQSIQDDADLNSFYVSFDKKSSLYIYIFGETHTEKEIEEFGKWLVRHYKATKQ